MNDQRCKRKQGKEPCPGSRAWENHRARDPWSPRLSNCHLQINCAGILAICPGSDKSFLRVAEGVKGEGVAPVFVLCPWNFHVLKILKTSK